MSVLPAIIAHCEVLMRTQSGTEYLRVEIGKIRDLAREGLSELEPTVIIHRESYNVTGSPSASLPDVERQPDQ